MLGGHPRVSKSVDDGEVEAWWECRTHHIGRAKARTWVENAWTWNYVKGGEHLLGKSDRGSGRRGRPGRPHENRSHGPTFNRSSIRRRPDSHTCFFLFSFCLLGDVAFSEYLCTTAVLSLYRESTSYVFFFRMVFFYLVTTGWIFYISLYYVRIQRIQKISRSYTEVFIRSKKNLTPII